MLELFLKKITNLDYIYLSKEFQIFLRDPGDYKSLIKTLTINEVKSAQVITDTFPRYLVDALPVNLEEKYIESENIFKSTAYSLNEFRERCLVCVDNFDVFESDLISFLSELKEIGNIFTSKTLDSSNRDSFFNPYIILLD